MNIVQELLREHSKAATSRITEYVGSNPRRFARLVEVYLAGPYRITQRAAWPLGNCVEQYPRLLKPHFLEILKAAQAPGIHDSVKRNTVRLLQFVEIPTKYQGKVADLCFRFLLDKREPIAVRAFSMTVLANLSQVQQVLQQELRIVIEDQLPYGSPGFVSRARKILKGLNVK